MHQRPIGELIDALRLLGVRANAESPGGCPPIVVEASRWRGGNIQISATQSSQFASGMMLAAPYAQNGLTLKFVGRLVSKPYIRMTAEVMRAFGARIELSESQATISSTERYRGTNLEIEPDASAASYFLAAAAIVGGQITVDGLGRKSIQGDLRFADCLEQMGCRVAWRDQAITVQGPARRGIDVDMSDISDTVPTLAAVALFVDGPTRIRGVGHIRRKESDRIGDVARELRKLGAEVQEFDDGLRITPGILHGAELETYDDHRLAMSFSVIGLKLPGVSIRDPECVGKTYPGFFDDLDRIIRT